MLLRLLFVVGAAACLSACDSREFDTGGRSHLRLVHDLGGNVTLNATLDGAPFEIGSDRGNGFLPDFQFVSGGRRDVRIFDGANELVSKSIRIDPDRHHTGILVGRDDPTLVLVPDDTLLVDTDEIRVRVVHAHPDWGAIHASLHLRSFDQPFGELVREFGELDFGETSDFAYDTRLSLTLVIRRDDGDPLTTYETVFARGMTNTILFVAGPATLERAFGTDDIREWTFR